VNDFGQLGDGTSASSATPVQINGLSQIVGIASGAAAFHSFALKADGTVWAWGINSSGHLGLGTVTDHESPPVPIAGLTGVAALSAGGDHTLAVKTDGTVWSWGDNSTGQLGNDTAPYRPTPALVTGISSGIGVAGGLIHSLALTSDGRVYAWGDNGNAQLGNGTTDPAAAPVPISESSFAWKAATPVLSVVPGIYTYELDVAITSSTANAAIHYTLNGADPTEGDPTIATGASVQVTASLTLKARAFAAGVAPSNVATALYTLKVATPTMSPEGGAVPFGQLVALASTTNGAEIHYTTDASPPTLSSPLYVGPIQLIANTTLTAIAFRTGWQDSDSATGVYTVTASGAVAAGASFSLVLDTSGNVWSWGANDVGQLGDGSIVPRPYPAPVVGIAGVAALAAGGKHAHALIADGTVWAWGSNDQGQLGEQGPTLEISPVRVTGVADVVAVAAGGGHSIALKADGTVWSWGANDFGQLGDGGTSASSVPIRVNGLPPVVAIAGGLRHSLAVAASGALWTWGANDTAQLGTGNHTEQHTPVQITTLPSVAAVSGGASHSLALKTDGTTWSWGSNSNGQLGDTSGQDQSSPVQAGLVDCDEGNCPPPLPSVNRIAGGGLHSLALDGTGSVWAWGANDHGQLGVGSFDEAVAPTPAGGTSEIANIIRISAGTSHSVALASDGSVWAWGRNSSGQVGDGTGQDRNEPVKISEAGFGWRVARPAFSTASGTYESDLSIVITCATPGAAIHYTTDGTEPQLTSPSVASGGTVAVTRSLTLKARAWKDPMPPSNLAVETYTLHVPNPTLMPPPGDYDTPQTVTVTFSALAESAHYTTNGVEPTVNDPSIASGGTIPVEQTQTLWVATMRSGWQNGGGPGSYRLAVLAPTLTPPSGTYSAPQTVTVAVTTPGATIHYTSDGTNPTTSSPTIESGGTVFIDHNATLKAIALRADLLPSQVATAGYVFRPITPVATPAGGTHVGPQWINLATPTPEAVIRYTVDGTLPMANSPLYQSPILVEATTLLRFVALREGWSASNLGSAAYTIEAALVAVPSFNPPPGSYTTTRQVTVSCATPGSVIHYTLTGADPTEADPVVQSGSAIVIDHTAVLKARAWLPGVSQSAVRKGTYAITGAVSSGGNFTLILRSDGSVWAFGSNDDGQLGNGTNASSATPVPVTGLTDVVAISAGATHGLALKGNGTVWAWGHNGAGQLGDGTNSARNVPFQTVGLPPVTAISAGSFHSLALAAPSGEAWAWGENGYGQLGDFTTVTSLTPVRVKSVPAFVRIAGGGDHSLGLTASGFVWSWGRNQRGQLGRNTSSDQSAVPASVPTLTGVSDIDAGAWISVALRTDGSSSGVAWEWGNYIDAVVALPVPLERRDIADVTAVSAGGRHYQVLKSDSTVWAWGANWGGALGDGSDGASRPDAAPVQNVFGIVEMDAGHDRGVALGADGSVWSWGLGVLGPEPTPAKLQGFSATNNSALAEDPDGDGLPTWQELQIGTDPYNPDTNGDGLPDGLFDVIDPLNLDHDADGVINALERQIGTDPFNSDTDADGVPDGADCFPVDSTRSECPPPDPGDVTPPVITLDEPQNAVLISSTP
jgi:alpha-tubulin suppressor-like RCC1 family protein